MRRWVAMRRWVLVSALAAGLAQGRPSSLLPTDASSKPKDFGEPGDECFLACDKKAGPCPGFCRATGKGEMWSGSCCIQGGWHNGVQAIGEGEGCGNRGCELNHCCVRDDPPPPNPRIIGGWTDCGERFAGPNRSTSSGPGPGPDSKLSALTRNLALTHDSSGITSAAMMGQTRRFRLKARGWGQPKAPPPNCTREEENALQFKRAQAERGRDPSYSHEWGATAILPGKVRVGVGAGVGAGAGAGVGWGDATLALTLAADLRSLAGAPSPPSTARRRTTGTTGSRLAARTRT
jgi:hypothetical protein